MRFVFESVGPLLAVFAIFAATTVLRRLSYGHAAFQPADRDKISVLLMHVTPFMLLSIVYSAVVRARLELWVELLLMAGVMVAFASVTYQLLRRVADES